MNRDKIDKLVVGISIGILFVLVCGSASIFTGMAINARNELMIVNVDAESGNVISVQYPLATDGDSIYAKDVYIPASTVVGFDGEVTDLFDNRFTTMTNTTATNPKQILVELKRPLQTSIFGLGTMTGDFSNLKVTAKLVGVPDNVLIDESADSTPKTVVVIQDLPPTTFSALLIEFHTTNTVSISTIAISKALQRIARLQGITPAGNVKDVRVTDQGRLDVSALTEKILIATGQIPGTTFIEKFGRNADVDISPGNEFIWSRGGVWVPPTQARIHNLTSSDPDDTILGSGAGQVKVIGLDASWNPQEETIDMDGAGVSATSGFYVIVHRMEVVSCGATGFNEGTIIATAAVDGTVTSEIPLGKGKTLMAIYGVKTGATLYLEQVYGSINAASNPANQPAAIMELKVITSADTATPCTVLEHVWGLAAQGTSNASHEFKVSKAIPERSIIYIQTESVTQDNTDMSAGFDGYLIDN